APSARRAFLDAADRDAGADPRGGAGPGRHDPQTHRRGRAPKPAPDRPGRPDRARFHRGGAPDGRTIMVNAAPRPQTPAPVLSIADLEKSYGSISVLQSISLTMAPGDFLVLVGPSGCGKSTLLNCIAGL